MEISGNIIDIPARRIYPGTITVTDGKISRITENQGTYTNYILPGFVDAHVHVESSMLTPSEFARLAVVHGTIATVSDPHEIANVLGVEGVRYMLDNGKTVPFKFCFGAPSCVPATTFETAGAVVTVEDVTQLLALPEVLYLTEMMNFPGVLYQQPDVMAKIAAAQQAGKPVDGHAPGLRGDAAKQYIDAGISTDHECFTAEEALDKLKYGMKILIREGSAARNFDALIPLLQEHYEMMMFCSDDKHPDNLVEGHINVLVRRALALGNDLFKVLQVACINPVLHYKIPAGLLRVGDAADFIVTNDIQTFDIQATYVNGVKVAEGGQTLIAAPVAPVINNFDCKPVRVDQLRVVADGNNAVVKVIEALDGQLITNAREVTLAVVDGEIKSDVAQDVLKLVVVNRYHDAPVAVAFIKNFGFKRGAIASSVAHDSHNIIAVGVDDAGIAGAINAVIAERGGVSVVDGESVSVLGLPVAGLMSNLDGYVVAEGYSALDRKAKELGSALGAPFMTLSFMALLVIPHLKLSDRGLFDGDTFNFTNLIA